MDDDERNDINDDDKRTKMTWIAHLSSWGNINLSKFTAAPPKVSLHAKQRYNTRRT